jgi:hypothetical protein
VQETSLIDEGTGPPPEVLCAGRWDWRAPAGLKWDVMCGPLIVLALLPMASRGEAGR